MVRHGEVKYVGGKRVASPEYRSWQMMKNRCGNPNCKDFAKYGGRGIVFDQSWSDFNNFLADMGRRPSSLHTLEREDNNKGYCKSNCVWATREAQSRNRAYVKLSPEKAAEIRTRYANKELTQGGLAQAYGVSQILISLVIRGRLWRAGIGGGL